MPSGDSKSRQGHVTFGRFGGQRGKEGGQRAASKLSDGIIQSLPGRNNHHLWVYVFLNKKGLSDTLGRVSKFTAKLRLDDFIIGFNHASERFIMADVGYAKEGADAKIRGARSMVASFSLSALKSVCYKLFWSPRFVYLKRIVSYSEVVTIMDMSPPSGRTLPRASATKSFSFKVTMKLLQEYRG